MLLRLVTSDRPLSTLQEQAEGILSLYFNCFIANNYRSFQDKDLS